jgi:hypothetical protein
VKYPLLEYAGPVERSPSFWQSESAWEIAAAALIVAFLLTYFALLTAGILAIDFMLLRVI